MTQARQRCAIGIDCPPGQPRPCEVFLRVLHGTGLHASDFELQFKIFGAWLWHLKFDAEKQRLFLINRPLFNRRLQKLVETGLICGAVIKPEGPILIVDNERTKLGYAADAAYGRSGRSRSKK